MSASLAVPPCRPPSEAHLMHRIAAGDESAFALLMRRHAARLARRMRAMVGAAYAEDLTQETLLRAWCAAGRFDAAKGSIGAWLDRIARNLAIDHLRRAAPMALPLDPAWPSAAPDALARLAAREQAARLRQGMRSLPATQRLALLGQDGGAGGRAHEGRLYRARIALRVLMGEV
ncbi:MAG: RNA polymerase subunit sigma [Rhodospirillales bacterium]|nr:RNA polymerase subunit sigma [Rhodospirillales bacterium]